MLFENGPDNGDNKDDDDNHDDDDDDDDGHIGRGCNNARGPLGGWCFKPWCSKPCCGWWFKPGRFKPWGRLSGRQR